MNPRSLSVRLYRHHLPLAVLSAAMTSLISWALPSSDGLYTWSMGSAYAALLLLAATLLLGPFRTRRTPISFDLRRDVGIWTGIVTAVHVVIGLQVHMRGRMWLYFVPPSFPKPPVRFDLFGLANYTGLVAGLMTLVLMSISSDFALRSLGGGRWKQIQKSNYAIFAIVAVYGAAYQISGHRSPALMAAFAAIVLLTPLLRRVLRLRSP